MTRLTNAFLTSSASTGRYTPAVEAGIKSIGWSVADHVYVADEYVSKE